MLKCVYHCYGGEEFTSNFANFFSKVPDAMVSEEMKRIMITIVIMIKIIIINNNNNNFNYLFIFINYKNTKNLLFIYFHFLCFFFS